METTIDEDEKLRFLNDHIPYKISRLISIFLLQEKCSDCNMPIGYKELVSRVCQEDGFTSGRLLLHFLGLNANSNGSLILYKTKSSDDIFVNDLGGIKFNQNEITVIPDNDKAIIIT